MPEAARLEQLTAAAENVLRPGVTPDKLLVDAPEAEIPQTMTVDVAPGLPRGEAAVFLAYSRGPLPAVLRENHLPWRRLPLDVNTAGQVRLPEYLIAKDWQSGSDWRAEAFYRGHVRAAAFNFAPLRGVEIAYAPQKRQPAKVTVFGQSKQRLGIMFIFDCSGSMGTPIVGKNPAAAKEPKINVAREAFHEVLDSLAADEGACRAGADRLRASRLAERRLVHAVPQGRSSHLGRRQQQDRAREPAQPAQPGPGEPQSGYRRRRSWTFPAARSPP